MGDDQYTVTGEVIDQDGNVIRPAPTVPQQRTPHPPPPDPPPGWPPGCPGAAPPAAPRRRVPWKWLTLAVVLLCIGAPATGIFVWVVKGTIDAGKGSPTPTVALLEFFYTFNDDPDSELKSGRYVVDSQEEIVLGIRAEFMAEWIAFKKANPDHAGSMLKIASPQQGMEPEYERIDGDGAEVLSYFSYVYPLEGQSLFMNSGGKPWKAEVRKQRDGWRIWSISIPDYCLKNDRPAYIRCDR